jgi:hypothetical protein
MKYWDFVDPIKKGSADLAEPFFYVLISYRFMK